MQPGRDEAGPVGLHAAVGGGEVQARVGGQVSQRTSRKGDGGGGSTLLEIKLAICPFAICRLGVLTHALVAFYSLHFNLEKQLYQYIIGREIYLQLY